MIGKRWIIGCWIAAMGGCLMACAPQAVREAEDVVAQADSLWHEGKQYGIDEGDSAELAQAYETLGQWQCLPTDEYAHTCYHYGKLLRAKENPVEAMQAFISATHSGTKDYHILGRVYNNMGDICHLAGEFQLSYDMFEQSANMYLKNGDSLLYYYCLNDMAFELAEQGKKDNVLSLLSEVETSTTDQQILTKVYESKARLYYEIGQYDSVLYCSNAVKKYDCNNPTLLVLRAQAFDELGVIDSALNYANIIMNTPAASIQDKYNMLYIIAHYDSTNTSEDILNQTSLRADLGMIMDNQHAKHAQASEVLNEDLTQKPHKKMVIASLLLLFVVITLIGVAIFFVRRRRKLFTETQLLSVQNDELKAQQIQQHNEHLRQIEDNCKVLANSDNIMDSLQWKDYDKLCECINTHFFLLADKLKAEGCLNEKEIRLCVLVLIGSLSDKKMADILYYSYNTIRSTKRTLAMKLGTTSANLRAFLIEKAAK